MHKLSKIIYAAVLILVMMTLFCVTASAATFSDVSSDHWASKEITWTFDRGLMNGTSTTTFDPDGETLRGQMAVILYRYAGTPAVEQIPVYSDVNANH